MSDFIVFAIFFTLWVLIIWTAFASFIVGKKRKKVKHENDPRLCIVPNDGCGRFICSPNQRKFDVAPSRKKVYVFRKGEELPKSLKLIRICDDFIIQNSHSLQKEALINTKIDATNLGYNALIDYVCEPLPYSRPRRHGVVIRARAGLIVSENYRWNLDDLERNIDESKPLIYGAKCYDEEP